MCTKSQVRDSCAESAGILCSWRPPCESRSEFWQCWLTHSLLSATLSCCLDTSDLHCQVTPAQLPNMSERFIPKKARGQVWTAGSLCLSWSRLSKATLYFLVTPWRWLQERLYGLFSWLAVFRSTILGDRGWERLSIICWVIVACWGAGMVRTPIQY